MKKVLPGFLLLLLMLGGIFYKQILATIDFYQYQRENHDTFIRANILWKKLPFTSTEKYRTTDELLSFESLQLPIPFPATRKAGDDAALALGEKSALGITQSSAAATFFRMHNFTKEEETAACDFLSKTSGRGACTTHYNFLRAFLELNPSDIHLFSSIKNKELYNRLLTIRAQSLPGTIISGFETGHLRGFLYTMGDNNYVAEIFDEQDQQYHLEFTNLSQADVAFVLSNTTVTSSN